MEIQNQLHRELYQQVRMSCDDVMLGGHQDACYYLVGKHTILRLNVAYGRFSVRTLFKENGSLVTQEQDYQVMEIINGEECAYKGTVEETSHHFLYDGNVYEYELRQNGKGVSFHIQKLKKGTPLSIQRVECQKETIKVYFVHPINDMKLIAYRQSESYVFAPVCNGVWEINASDFKKLHASEYELIAVNHEKVLPLHVDQLLHYMMPVQMEKEYRIYHLYLQSGAKIIVGQVDELLQPAVDSIIYDEEQLKLSGSYQMKVERSTLGDLSMRLLWKTNDESDEVEAMYHDHGDTFTLTISKMEMKELQNRHPKRWNLLLEVKHNDEILAMMPVAKSSLLNHSIVFENKWIIDDECIAVQFHTTKQKSNLFLAFLAPVHIQKINYMEYVYGKVRIHMRMNKEITGMVHDLHYKVFVDGKWQNAKFTKRGAKTLLLKVPCVNMYDFVENLKLNGLQLQITYHEEQFVYTVKDLDYSRMFYTWRQHVFNSKRYRNLGKKLYRVFLRMPVKKNKILFESFLGRNVSGNPKYLYEYLYRHDMGKSYKMYWILNDLNEAVPGPGKKILRRSIRYYYHMATAGFWMFNTRQDNDIVKRKKTIYLQTWHGTPLKRLGWDMDDVNMATQSNIIDYKRQFYQNSRRWDYMLAQNQYSADIFKRCFVFRKEMLAYGYPANDVLFEKNNEQDIRVLKEKMGIPLDKKVILYAPTWRDDNFVRKGYYQMKMELDLNLMREKLGDEYVVLLRMHYLIMNVLDIAAYEGFAYDFSSGSDIQELYLVSDVLITDYSSVMFDYATLKRPIIFYTYDIDAYRDSLRGFYFDFEKEACGPICRSTSEVVSAIRDMSWRESYHDKEQAFYAKFNHLDDGQAAKRVLEVVLDRNRVNESYDY